MTQPQIVDLRKKTETPSPSEDQKVPIQAASAAKSAAGSAVAPEMFVSWEAGEFPRYEKNTKAWTRNVMLFFGAIAVIFLFMKNILGAAIAIIGGLAMILYAFKEPRKLRYGISERNIRVDKKTYPFETLQSFWIFYDPPEVKELSIHTKKNFDPYIKLPLGNQDPVAIRKILLKFLPEIEQKESAFDVIARRIRF